MREEGAEGRREGIERGRVRGVWRVAERVWGSWRGRRGEGERKGGERGKKWEERGVEQCRRRTGLRGVLV